MRDVLEYLGKAGYNSPAGIAFIKHASNKPLLKRVLCELGLRIKSISEKDIQFCRGVIISHLYSRAVIGDGSKSDSGLIYWLDSLDKEIVDKTINITFPLAASNGA
jgi:hypothetical protein